MQLDPFTHLRLQDEDVRRKMTQKSLERVAREARSGEIGTTSRLGARYRVNVGPLKLAGLLATLALIAGAGISWFGA